MTARAHPDPRPITTAANVALACAATCAITFVLCVGSAVARAALLLLTDGLIAVGWLAAAAGLGLALLRAIRIRFNAMSLRLACAAALGLGLQSLLILGLGLLGAMNRASAVAIIGAGLTLFAWIIPSFVKADRREQASAWSWLWLLAMPGLAVALACAMLPPGLLWQGAGVSDPHGYDVVSYHLQIPREWFELGRIEPLTHNVFSYFPLGVEMHYLLAMHLRGGPWAGMYLAQLMNVGFIAMSVLAVCGVLRELGARATLGAAAAATTPWMILLAPVGYNESCLLLYATLAIGLMPIAMRAPAPLRVASLAGLMAGFACGAKPTAVPMVLLLVPAAAWIVAILFRLRIKTGGKEKGISTFSREMYLYPLIYVAAGVVAFSPWVVRNTVWTGNPAFPEATRILGRAHFTAEQVERWQGAHAARDDQRTVIARLRAFANQVLCDWRFAFALLPLACLAAVIDWRRAETLYFALILLILTVLWLALTHLQSRFFVLAIPVAAMLIGRLRDARAALICGAFVTLAALIGVGNLYTKLRANPHLVQFLGLERLTILTPLADVTLRDDEQLILLGDARAFLYDVPMSRLQYRTVFDVPPDAWMSGMRVQPGKTIVLTDPGELARFAQTYRNLPPIPDAAINRTTPYVERR